MSRLTAPRQRRVGVFGGAFDPPHMAHVALGQAAIEQLQLDALHVLPTGQAWHKTRTLMAAQHRVAMVELAFAAMPGVVVDRREIERSGPTYTVDTLQEIKTEQPDAGLFLLIGQDQAQAFGSWHDGQRILQLATIVVAERSLPEPFSGTFNAKNSGNSGFLKLKMPLMHVSATEIRQRIARHEDVTALVGQAVARYIDQHQLYQNTL